MVIKLLFYNYTTLGAIAALAFIVACVTHEVIGHASMCIAVSGHITLLSSVYSHCSYAGALTSGAGPFMSLAVGAMCWAILRCASASLSANWRLFIVLTMAFTFLWAAMSAVSSAVTNIGDWVFVIRDLRLQPNWLWRCLIGVLGLYLYYRFLQLIAFYLPSRTPLVVPYLIAGIVCCVAALFFNGSVLPALYESAGESFGNMVGLLFIAYYNSSRAESWSSAMSVERSNGWLLTAVLVTLLFFATLGRGFVFDVHA